MSTCGLPFAAIDCVPMAAGPFREFGPTHAPKVCPEFPPIGSGVEPSYRRSVAGRLVTVVACGGTRIAPSRSGPRIFAANPCAVPGTEIGALANS